jgi:hypothetical protein
VASPLDQALETAMSSVPGCIAAGYVDITTGILISAKTTGSHPQEVFDLVSGVTVGLFHDRHLAAIETWFGGERTADDSSDNCQEIVVASDRLLYLFARCRTNDDHVAVFVTEKSDIVGLVMAKSRVAVNALDCAV